MILTIFTPTYNRASFLPTIYESLLKQSCFDFEWLIIDDGSKDNTKSIVDKLIKQSSKFPIRYVYKDNGGKHTAINLAAKEASGFYILWLDSDDRIIPYSLAPFIEKLKISKLDNDVSAVVGLRLGEDLKPLGNYIPNQDEDVRFLSFLIKNHVKGDYSWAIKKNILKKYPFPIYQGEKFCTEGVILNRISEKYKTRFVTLPLIIGEYIKGGLTDQLHRLTKENPFGYLTYYKDIICSNQATFWFKLQTSILYWNQVKKTEKKIPIELRPNLFLSLMRIPSFIIIKLYNYYKH